ncbi:MAG: Rne/Rng family ribonuclease, partial [Deltaproteobacteria bacterium]|nr:Rne/Rng family ribonuclease [Deltaproteobacteria bacterium]
MPNDLIINVTAGETRVAFLESGVLSELIIERHQEIGIAGNIYKGKVQRVIPGMNAAFVEIGQEKAAFLYATDFSQEIAEVDDSDEDEDAAPPPQLSDLPEGAENEESDSQDEIRKNYRWAGKRPIQSLLKPNDEILVQVARDPISTKGARITSHISLPGRFLVYMPTWGKIGISKKVESFEERRRLRQI